MEDIRENGRILSNSKNKITEKAIKGKGLFKKGSIILATSATIGEHAMITDEALANQRFTNFEIKEEFMNKILDKYVFYYFYIIDEWCKNNTEVSSFPTVNMKGLLALKIPIPPIEVQEYVVSILDNFDRLVNDIEEGLPREIELRQKQYEYFRDSLLSFDR